MGATLTQPLLTSCFSPSFLGTHISCLYIKKKKTHVQPLQVPAFPGPQGLPLQVCDCPGNTFNYRHGVFGKAVETTPSNQARIPQASHLVPLAEASPGLASEFPF